MADKRFVKFKAEYAAMLAPFVSTEEARFYLQGIGVFPHKDDGVLLVATNGHTMGVIHDSDGETNGDWICPVTPLMLQAMKADMRSAWDEDDGEYQYDARGRIPHLLHFVGDVAYLTAAEFLGKKVDRIGKHHVLADYAPAIDGTFPEWRRVIPTELPAPAPVPFNAEYLAKFGRVARIRNHLAKPLVTLFNGEREGPAVVRVDGVPEFVGVLMPVRLEPFEPLPDWLAA